MSVPVYVICRDRLTVLLQLVGWLEDHGFTDITLIDNDSAWPPLLGYYGGTPHRVVRLGRNVGKYSPWLADVVPDDLPYIVTDPDVVPVAECPEDALERFSWLLDRCPDATKVGFGFYLDDIPDCWDRKAEFLTWERQFFSKDREQISGVFSAEIDTTFALYRPGLKAVLRETLSAGMPYPFLNALRTGAPYLARHLSSYLDSGNLSEEDRHYAARCGEGLPKDSVGTWIGSEGAG